MIGTILNIIIDKGIKGVHASEKFFGIAETVSRQSGAAVERLPGVIADDGEITYVGIDDINTLMVYFKINSTSITLIKNGTGDRYGDYRNVFNVSAFIYWDRQQLNLSSDQMIMLMQSRIPIGVTGLKDIKTAAISLTKANASTLQIYSQEYSSNEQLRPLPANKQIVQLDFNIEITFNPECFRDCPECAEK
jgi:hypothetical protein